MNHIIIKNFATHIRKKFLLMIKMITKIAMIGIIMIKNLISKSLMKIVIKLMMLTVIAMIKNLTLASLMKMVIKLVVVTMKNLML